MHKPGLDLLRAIAIIWVMLFHSFVVGGLGPDYAWLSRYGWMGVDLFFVLSGFLIGSQVFAPLAAGRGFSFRDFYLRRGFRILPAFWVVLALYMVFPSLREAPGMEPWWKFISFSLNFNIDYGLNQAFSHAWSLCVEEHFYLIFPVLALFLTRRRSTALCVAVGVGVLLLGLAVRTGVWLHDAAMEQSGAPARNWFVEDIYYPTWNRLDGLLAGVALATIKLFRPQAWLWAQARANGFLLLGLAVMALSFWLFRDRVGLLANSIGWPVMSTGLALVVLAGAGDGSWIARRQVPGAAWLAAISYSLYLTHKATFHVVQSVFGEALAGRGEMAFAVYAAATALVGAVLYYSVERPFLRLRDRLPRFVNASPVRPAASI